MQIHIRLLLCATLVAVSASQATAMSTAVAAARSLLASINTFMNGRPATPANPLTIGEVADLSVKSRMVYHYLPDLYPPFKYVPKLLSAVRYATIADQAWRGVPAQQQQQPQSQLPGVPREPLQPQQLHEAPSIAPIPQTVIDVPTPQAAVPVVIEQAPVPAQPLVQKVITRAVIKRLQVQAQRRKTHQRAMNRKNYKKRVQKRVIKKRPVQKRKVQRKPQPGRKLRRIQPKPKVSRVPVQPIEQPVEQPIVQPIEPIVVIPVQSSPDLEPRVPLPVQPQLPVQPIPVPVQPQQPVASDFAKATTDRPQQPDTVLQKTKRVAKAVTSAFVQDCVSSEIAGPLMGYGLNGIDRVFGPTNNAPWYKKILPSLAFDFVDAGVTTISSLGAAAAVGIPTYLVKKALGW